MLTKKQYDVLHDYYFLNLSLSEIAENNDITRQAVKDIVDRAVKQLNLLESKLHILNNLNNQKQSLNKALQCDKIDDIKKIINDVLNNMEV